MCVCDEIMCERINPDSKSKRQAEREESELRSLQSKIRKMESQHNLELSVMRKCLQKSESNNLRVEKEKVTLSKSKAEEEEKMKLERKKWGFKIQRLAEEKEVLIGELEDSKAEIEGLKKLRVSLKKEKKKNRRELCMTKKNKNWRIQKLKEKLSDYEIPLLTPTLLKNSEIQAESTTRPLLATTTSFLTSMALERSEMHTRLSEYL